MKSSSTIKSLSSRDALVDRPIGEIERIVIPGGSLPTTRAARLLLPASLVLLLMGLLSAGCGDDAESLPTGRVALQWMVGPFGCAEVNTSSIVVEMIEGRSDAAGRRIWQFSCDAGVGVIEGLRPGQYRFAFEGLTPQGEVHFVGTSPQIEVRSDGITTAPTVVLRATPADLVLRWNFGGPLCRQIGVSAVEAIAFDEYGTETGSKIAGCEEGDVTLTLRPGIHDIVIHGLGTEGDVTWLNTVRLELTRGEERRVDVSLEPLRR